MITTTDIATTVEVYLQKTTQQHTREVRWLISSDVIRGYNDTIILCLLLDGDSYGYEISKLISEISEGKYIIKETTLYSAFTRLESNGFIESYSGAASPAGRGLHLPSG